MKILHTADWHLGKKLDFYSRMQEQIDILNEICEIADREDVDLILIAGDLYDAFNPSTEAIDLFYKTLKRLAKNGQRPVVAIAGNHDSPNLIDAPDPLARECGIILVGHPKAIITPFSLSNFIVSRSVAGMVELELKNVDFPIRILHTPYANEVRLKEYLGEEKEANLNQILKDNWKDIADEFCDENGVNILITHLYMMKRGGEILEEPDGEKPIKIGNADLVYSDAVPPQINYTALGHLHGFRNIGTTEKPVVYSSSPLAYSFSETGQKKYVVILKVELEKPIEFTKIELSKGKQLVRKTFNDVNVAVNWLEENQDTLVELTLESETFMTAEERKKIYASHHGIIHIIPKVNQKEAIFHEIQDVNLNQDIKELFKDYFKTKNQNQEPNEDIMNLFNEILQYK